VIPLHATPKAAGVSPACGVVARFGGLFYTKVSHAA
jgi:hypothetical protein